MKTDIRRYLAADSAARRLKLNTEAGTTQSSVQNSRTLQKDLADEIRALLKQRYHPADRIREKIWVIQAIEVTPWKKFEDRHQEVLGSRHCSPATEAQHRGRNDTELSPKQQDPTKRFGRRNQGLAEQRYHPADRSIENLGDTRHRSNRVTELKVLGSQLRVT